MSSVDNEKLKDLLGEESSFTDMTDEERLYFVELLKEEMSRRESAGKAEQIREIVPIEKFLTEYYLGPDAKNIYDFWRDTLKDMFSDSRTMENNINSVVLSGCFSGDTKVSLLSGEEVSFEDLEKRYSPLDYFWVYSCDKDGNIVPGHAHNIHRTKIADRLYIIELDNGEKVKCTEDHKFLTRDGSYVMAKDLSPDDTLMPLYREYKCMGKYDHGTPKGYERVYNPKDEIWKVTHKVVSEFCHSDEIEELKNKYGKGAIIVTHHIDMDKLNNTPENLKPMECVEHFTFHKRHTDLILNDPVIGPRVRKKMSESQKRSWSNPEYKDRMRIIRRESYYNSKKMQDHWRDFVNKGIEFTRSEEGHKISIRNLEKWNSRDGFSDVDVQAWRDSIGKGTRKWWSSNEGEKEKDKRREIYTKRNESGETSRLLKEFWKTDRGIELKEEKRQKKIKENIERSERILKERLNQFLSIGLTEEELYKALSQSNSWRSAGKLLSDKFNLSDFDLSGSSHMNTLLRCLGLSSGNDYSGDRKKITDKLGLDYEYRNHTVKSIEIIQGKFPVYDFEVDDFHNFALSSGVFVHNSIGTGKSTVAEIMLLRKLYELSCFKNINSMFGLMSTARILFLYFSINKDTAEATGFGSIRAWIDASPYFNKNFPRSKRINSLLVFPEGITIAYGSRSSDAIGRNLICSIMDEANFINSNGDNRSGNIERAMEMYAGIVNRSNSRFIIEGGKNYSLNILVSSSTHESSATERQIAMSKDDPHALIASPSQWEVKPDKFSKEYFYVLKGTNYLEPQIIESTDDINNFRLSENLKKEKFVDNLTDFESIEKEIKKLPPHMQERFLKVPVDLKRGFEMNIIRSLQDLGGVSTGTTGKLFNSPAVFDSCIDPKFHHPFTAPEIVISTGDRIEIKDYLRSDFRLRHPERKRYIHIDQSTTTDSTGISCVYVDDVDIDEETGMQKPIVGVDFMLRINPPKPPKKIAIYKIRNFVVYLGRTIGMNIGKVTYDIFNSEESRQILEEMGFNVAYQSVDRTDKAYLDFVEMMYEGRVRMYDSAILRHELFNLIHYRDKRKVDHPKLVKDSTYTGKGSSEGSKDLSDSLVGAAENLLMDTISDSVGNEHSLEEFMEANRLHTAFEPDAMNADEMIDKMLEDTIDELEMSYTGMTGFGYF